MYRHILICGKIGVGKSTLVNRLAAASRMPLYGYKTLSVNRTADGTHEIFIFPPSDYSSAKIVAKIGPEKQDVYSSIFDTYGVKLLTPPIKKCVILMDEIGFLEINSPLFTAKILELLDGDIPIIGAVKSSHPNCQFLNTVRNHKNVDLIYIDENNRDNLFYEILNRRNNLYYEETT